jgi:hypothetical protein
MDPTFFLTIRLCIFGDQGVAGEQLVASTNPKLTTGRAQGVVLDATMKL